MQILVIGGTKFLGRAVVEAALARGHELTLFNRGSRPGLFPGVEELHGDRERDLSALDGRFWDAVVDTSGYVPRVVRLSVEKLAGQVGHYTFVSTLSVYADFSPKGIDECAPTGKLADESQEEITGESYGPLKALCEQVVLDAFSARAFIPRPGLIVGPHDPTDRFTYWPHRAAQGGEALAPGRPEREVQFIDVRDLAAWMVRMIEERKAGVFNANGPEKPLPFSRVIDACSQAAGGQSRFTWVDEDFLLAEGVEPWSELPLWMPSSDPQYAGFFNFNIQAAIESGLVFRPVEETAADTLAWDQTRPVEPLKAGLSREREQELLNKYHSQRGA